MSYLKLLLAIHVMVTIFLIGLVLIQKSSGGGFGSNPTSSVMNVRGRANFLTRATAVLAAIFLGNSLLMAIITSNDNRARKKLLEVENVPPVKVTDKDLEQKKTTDNAK